MHARNKEIQVELDAWLLEHSDAVQKIDAIRVSLGVRRSGGVDRRKIRIVVETVFDSRMASLMSCMHQRTVIPILPPLVTPNPVSGEPSHAEPIPILH